MAEAQRLFSSRVAWSVFDRVFRPWMRGRVRVHIAGRPGSVEPSFPLVLVANHESWWDGFLLREVQRRLRPKARFHAVMLERELAPRPFLRFLGGLGLEPPSLASNRRLIRTLDRLRVEDPTGVLAYFPQGVTRPGTPGPLAFRNGVIRVAEALAPATVLPVGLRLLPGVTSRFEAYLSVGSPLAVPGPGTLSLPLLEGAVAEEVEAIRAFVARHGEAAPQRFPRLPLPLPRAPEQPPLLDDVRSWISRN